MTTTNLQHVVGLAEKGGSLQAAHASDEETFQELSSWLMDALEHDASEDIAKVVDLARNIAPPAERYLSRAMRVVAGAQPLQLLEGVDEWLHLLAIPLFFFPRQGSDQSEVLARLECRAEIERSLENALGLGFASLRLCEYPVSIIELESLGMAQTRRVALDLLQQAESPFLTPPVVDVGASPEASHHLSLCWPAVWKVKDSQRNEHVNRITGAVRQSPKLAQFKHRADELIEREMLSQLGLDVRADVYMPALFHDAFTMYRIVELNIMLNHALTQFRATVNSVSFGVRGKRLHYTLLDTAGKALTADEIVAPEESAETISDAVRAACARHGVACTVSGRV